MSTVFLIQHNYVRHMSLLHVCMDMHGYAYVLTYVKSTIAVNTYLIKESQIIFIVVIHEVQDPPLTLRVASLAVVSDPGQSCVPLLHPSRLQHLVH